MDMAGGPLEDPQALAEIDLYAEVIIAASASDAPLNAGQIDCVLGLPPSADHRVQRSA